MNKRKRDIYRSGMGRMRGFLGVILLLVLSTFLTAFLDVRPAYADDLSGECYDGVEAQDGVTAMGQLQSPFGSTPNVCLGAASNNYFFQLAVEIPSEAVSANPRISAVDSNGKNIPMVQDKRKNLFLSSVPVHVNATTVGGCDTSAWTTIIVKIDGVKDQSFAKRQVCPPGNVSGFAHDTWIRTVTANGPNGSGSAREFTGYIGIDYGKAPTVNPDSQYTALQKAGLSSIKITGGNCDKVNCTFNAGSSEVSLTDGVLAINANKLTAGASYKISLNYNARAIDNSMPYDEWVNHTFTFDNGGKGFVLKESGETLITPKAFGADNLAYYTAANVAGAKVANDGSVSLGADAPICTGGAIGWLLCPVAELLNTLNGFIAGIIEGILMTWAMTDPTSKQAIQALWSVVVGIANLVLVIAFLVVIFSQATSVGLSAYGIKKMLPRIIAAAVLINLSFLLCGVAIDIVNIIGASVKTIIGVGIAAIPWPGGTVEFSGFGEAMLNITGGLMAAIGVGTTVTAVALVTGSIAFIFPIVAGGVALALITLLGLALREVLIVLLIVISPLAFVAMILPNTEPFFKKWTQWFFKLLIMYPVIAGIMYASVLAAKLILAGGKL